MEILDFRVFVGLTHASVNFASDAILLGMIPNLSFRWFCLCRFFFLYLSSFCWCFIFLSFSFFCWRFLLFLNFNWFLFNWLLNWSVSCLLCWSRLRSSCSLHWLSCCVLTHSDCSLQVLGCLVTELANLTQNLISCNIITVYWSESWRCNRREGRHAKNWNISL